MKTTRLNAASNATNPIPSILMNSSIKLDKNALLICASLNLEIVYYLHILAFRVGCLSKSLSVMSPLETLRKR